MDDLEQRLRGTYSLGPFGKRDFTQFIPSIQIEAADRIAALEAENAKLRELLKEARSIIILQHATRPPRYPGQHGKPTVIGEINAALSAVKEG